MRVREAYIWYLSARAIREYLAIARIANDDGGPNWGRAERELGEHARAANPIGRSTDSGAEIHRTGRRQCGDRSKRVRLELYVQHTPRSEGDLPQLVRVVAKT